MRTVQKYGGELVFSLRDEYGLIEVIDKAGLRSLHFETPIEQSSIDLRQPERLVFEYYRVLGLSLLFGPKATDLLVLGLGGGALCRFLLDARPDAKITAVEFREGVVDVAFNWFQLPLSPRLDTWVADAHAFVVQSEETFQIIFIDLYDALGMSDSLSSLRFFDDCVRRLGGNGVLALNLWPGQKETYDQTRQILQQLFGDDVYYVDVDDSNTVALALAGDCRTLTPKSLKTAARQLESATAVELEKYLKRLRRLDGSGLGH